MANFLNGVNIGTPGAYAFYTATQSRPVDILPFRTCYLIGYSSTGVTATKNTPTRISTLTDFINVFGASASTNNVRLFFDNSESYGNLYFVNVAVPIQYDIDILNTTAGSYIITINGVTKTLVVTGTPTIQEIGQDLIDLIDNDAVLNKEVTAFVDPDDNTIIILKAKNPLQSLTVTEDNALMAATLSTPAFPQYTDYVYTIQNAFDPTLEAGFVCAPEAFLTFPKSERLSIQVALENLASGSRYQWVALIDPGTPSEITNTDRAIAEAATYTSAQGHSCYYYPYVINLTDVAIPPSTGIAGLALLRYVRDGFEEPPAGALYPLKGVKDVVYKTSWSEQNVANPAGVNIILNKPTYGIVVWGARTLSSDPLLVFLNTRVILNIIINSLYRGFDLEIFSAIGGTGAVLNNIQRKAINLLNTFWQSGLLYGASPQEAYSVLGDTSVQVPALLQQGIANLFIWVVPATLLERLIINIKQTAIGDLQITVASDTTALQSSVSSGDVNESVPTT